MPSESRRRRRRVIKRGHRRLAGHTFVSGERGARAADRRASLAISPSGTPKDATPTSQADVADGAGAAAGARNALLVVAPKQGCSGDAIRIDAGGAARSSEPADAAGSRRRREDRDDRDVRACARRARVQVLRVQQDGGQQKRRAGIADARLFDARAHRAGFCPGNVAPAFESRTRAPRRGRDQRFGDQRRTRARGDDHRVTRRRTSQRRRRGGRPRRPRRDRTPRTRCARRRRVVVHRREPKPSSKSPSPPAAAAVARSADVHPDVIRSHRASARPGKVLAGNAHDWRRRAFRRRSRGVTRTLTDARRNRGGFVRRAPTGRRFFFSSRRRSEGSRVPEERR